MRSVRFGFLNGDHGGEIFHKIDAAFFARAAVPLFVMAGRAFVTQSRVAARAKPRHVAGFTAALGALHGSILSRGNDGSPDSPFVAPFE